MSTNNKYQQAKERMDTLFKFLVEEKGYKQYSDHLNSGDLKTGFNKRFSSKYSTDEFSPCETNGWKIGWHVSPFLYHISEEEDHALCSVTIKIFGEVGDKWLDFEFYSLSPEELMNAVDILEEKLFNAWRAVS